MQAESVEKIYKKVTQLEHVLLRPDTYVGSTSLTEESMWVVQDQKIILKKIKYVPALYKIFDEILVNAADNKQRDKKMSKIDVKINENGLIVVHNDGKTIPVQIHKEHKIYVSELIFGHLLTSSNYEDATKKVTGGRNGFGAKLANIFSQRFTVETGDSIQKKILTIEWSNNMKDMEQNIKEYRGKDYTTISFKPDFKKFGLSGGFTEDIINLFKKRVYDMAGILTRVKVYLNDKIIPVKDFREYVNLYGIRENPVVFSDADAEQNADFRWSVLITPSDGQFQQISFVNGIHTIKGGSHVRHVVDQIVSKMTPLLSKKAKDIQIKPHQIKAQMKVFINCLIENPAFDSQTKDTLTTQKNSFGSSYTVSDKIIKDINKSQIAEKILNSIRVKVNTKIDRDLKKLKNNRPLIAKLQDANLAGKSNDCILILTEGDSAKALAMSGIEYLGRDKYGVYPLRGKPLNVRELTTKQIMENNQLSNVIKIMGLHFGKVYQGTQTLRYSSVMIMADQDTDGSHIKGLIINFFACFWPSLVKIPGFLRGFITPIIRCRKETQKIDFFNENDYKIWKRTATQGWRIKYYKGLGTSTSAEAKEYFSNLEKHEVFFNFCDEKDDQAMDLIFNKKSADLRKKWLQESGPDNSLPYTIKQIKIQDFVNREYINFSHTDNNRSIPSIIDGLKPSQRKVLFSCFKRNLKNEIKVAQLAGYVSQHSAYHHGEQSLCGAIVNMAQNYIGSNNINLLLPIGQFGTRYMRGKDAASPRYVFTALNPLTRYLFPEADDHIVDYLEEENQMIEPNYYYPILPLILINGCEGIGTGWSTTIHPHKVQDVLEMVRKRMKNQYKLITLGWEGFKGAVELQRKGVYSIKGIYQIEEQTVVIREIPINKSITEYKGFLETLTRTIDNPDPDFDDLKEYHSGDQIQFVATFAEGKMPREDQLEKFLKIKTTLQMTNMTLFDSNRKIRKYEEVSDILEEFYKVRIKSYTKRKDYLITRFKRQVEILDSKISFIDRVVQGKFRMMGSRQEWIQQLIKNKYPKFHELTQVKSTKVSEYLDNEDNNKEFNYLLSMPIWSICSEKIREFQRTRNQVSQIMKYYENITEIQMWEKDLNEFQQAWESAKQGKEMKAAKDAKKRAHQHMGRRSAIAERSGANLANGNGKRNRRGKKIVDDENEDEVEELRRNSEALKKVIRKFQPKNIQMGNYLTAKSSGHRKRQKNKQSEDEKSDSKAEDSDINILEIEEQGLSGRKKVKTDTIQEEPSQKEHDKSLSQEKPAEDKFEYNKPIEVQVEKEKEEKPLNAEESAEKKRLDGINSLLSKYLKPEKDGENLSLEERIKARLNASQNNIFSSSYQQEKPQEKPVEKEDSESLNYDFLLD